MIEKSPVRKYRASQFKESHWFFKNQFPFVIARTIFYLISDTITPFTSSIQTILLVWEFHSISRYGSWTYAFAFTPSRELTFVSLCPEVGDMYDLILHYLIHDYITLIFFICKHIFIKKIKSIFLYPILMEYLVIPLYMFIIVTV